MSSYWTEKVKDIIERNTSVIIIIEFRPVRIIRLVCQNSFEGLNKFMFRI